MKKINLFTSALILSGSASAQNNPTPEFQGKLGKTLKETTQSWPEYKTKAPKDAPNVIYILIDDIGYGASSAFGGLIPTPNIDNLANNGLRYINFHTNAISSPTRSGLLTGRNSHSVHVGYNTGAGTPGYDRVIPFTKGFVSEILRENGYNTFAVGKWQLTPNADQTQSGPFNRWAVGRGFDKYFGFQSYTDPFHPLLWEGTNKVELDTNEKRVVDELITDRAINYISEQKSITPDKPFFLYFAPRATHAPNQVEKVWIDKFKGKYDRGWDWYREQVLINQKKLGVVPEYVELPPSAPGVKKWESLSNDEKRLYLRHMEVYAGFLAKLDFEIGKLVNHLRDIDQLDNTLIFLSIGDNGSAKAGGVNGTLIRSDNEKLTPAELLKKSVENIDLIGTDESIVTYPLGWAEATNTPFRYFKSDGNGEGGSHNPLIVYWPKQIKEKGGIRNQFSHVIDILPTTLELIGAKLPEYINGYKQDTLQGISFAYTIHDAKVSGKHTLQYFEIAGSRAIYKDGWKAGAFHGNGNDFDKDKWELFKLDEDFNERIDLAEKNPKKLEELKKVFDEEAKKYNIYPLIGKGGSGEPNPFEGRKQIVLFPGISQLTVTPNLNNQSFALTAVVDLTGKLSEGVLFSVGGKLGGFTLFVQNGILQAEQNVDGYKTNRIVASKQLNASGKTNLTFEYIKNTSNDSDNGVGSLYINNEKVGEAPFTSEYIYSNEGISVGKDIITTVSKKYNAPFAFNGTLKRINIDLK